MDLASIAEEPVAEQAAVQADLLAPYSKYVRSGQRSS